jgi:type IV fimbrial biogenesis protein FimT
MHGVTLIELMVVLAISAILLAIGVPMMSTFVDRNRVATQVNELIADIALTRSEALARRGRVILCRSADPTAAGAQCDAAATDWNSGWIVFVDNTAAGDPDPFQRDTADASERPIRVFTRTSPQVTITASPALAGLSVTADGTTWTMDGNPLSSLNAGAEPLRIDFAGTDNANRRSLCVATTGRARTSNTFGSCS